MHHYITYCTDEQTSRAYALLAPIDKEYPPNKAFTNLTDWFPKWHRAQLINPSTEAMIGWLFTQGVIVGLSDVTTLSKDCSKFCVFVSAREPYHIASFCADTYGEAVLQAIDDALNYLETEKK